MQLRPEQHCQIHWLGLGCSRHHKVRLLVLHPGDELVAGNDNVKANPVLYTLLEEVSAYSFA